MKEINFESLRNKKISDDFSVNGAWAFSWEALQSEDTRKYGILEYVKNNLKLSLFQGFNNKRKQHVLLNMFQNGRRYPDIFGVTMTNVYFKLFNVFQISNQPVFTFVDLKKQILGMQYFLFSSSAFCQNVKYDYFTLDIDHLDQILPIYSKSQFNIKDDQSATKYKFLCSFIYHHRYIYVLLKIEFNKINYLGRTKIILQSNKSFSEKEVIDLSFKFERMMAVILGFGVNLQNIFLKDKDKQTYYLFPLLSHSLLQSKNLNVFNSSILPRLGTIDNLRDFMKEWFSMSQELELLINNYLLTINFKTTIDNELINLTRGIEAFYRKNKVKIKYKRNKQYECKARKRYSHEYLREKIDHLLDTMPFYIVKDMKEKGFDRNIWEKSIVKTRVFAIHGKDNTAVIHNFKKLIVNTNILKFLVHVFILQQLGFTDFDETSSKEELEDIINTRFGW